MYNNYNCGRKGTFSRDKIIYKIERNDYFSLSLSPSSQDISNISNIIPLNHSVLSTDRMIHSILRGCTSGQRILLVTLPPRTFLLLILVRFHVFRQVIAPHEPFPARGASEPLLPGVRAQMTLQLVAPREPLAAEKPVADEGPFARVPSEMRLQMGRLPVHFAATRHVAHVLPLPVEAELAPSVLRLTIRATAPYALPAGLSVILGREEVVVGGRCKRPLIGVVLGARGELRGTGWQRVMLYRRDEVGLVGEVGRVGRPRGRVGRDARHRRVRRRRERLRNLAVTRGTGGVPVGGLARLKMMMMMMMTAQRGIVRLIVNGRTSVIDCGGLMHRHWKIRHGSHAWHRRHAHL